MNKIRVYRSLMVIGSVLLLGATFTHAGGRDVKQVKVTSDKAPDCSTMASMLASATKGCKTNDEKAIGIYNFLRQMLYHKNYPNEKGGVSSLKLINVYGWSLCGGLHTVESSFWKELGWEYRYVGWSNPGHTTAEAFYDDSWHYLDTFLKFYAWRKDANAPGGRTIASQDDIQKNPDEILTNGFVYDKGRAVQYQKGATLADNPRSMAFLVCGDKIGGVKSGVNSNKIMGGSDTGKVAHQGILFDDPSYSTDINLNLGYSLDLYWTHIPAKNKGWFWNGQKWEPGHSCGDKDYRNDPIIGPIFEPYSKGPDGKKIPGFRRSYANGTLSFDLSPITPAILNSLVASENVQIEGDVLVAADASMPASITIDLSGQAYIMIKGKGEGEGVDSFEVSIDDGATFVSADIADFTKIVLGKYKCQAKVTFKKLTSLKLDALVQHNQDSLTYLVPGKNKITVSAMDAKALGENELVVTIAYRPGFREIDILEKVSSSAYEIAKAHNADWSSDPVYVRKRFKAKDLPASFVIDVTIPEGKFLAHPKMLFLRREIVAPSQDASAEEGLLMKTWSAETAAKAAVKAAPLPTDATTATIQGKPAVKDALISADKSGVNLGSSSRKNVIAKDAGFSAFLMNFDISTIPANSKIYRAELVFGVWDPYNKGPKEVQAIEVTTPWDEMQVTWSSPATGKTWKNGSFTVGADTVAEKSSSVIVKGETRGDVSNPPDVYTLDVTKMVTSWVSGSANNGVAITALANRDVDAGRTGRFQMLASERNSQQEYTPKLIVSYK